MSIYLDADIDVCTERLKLRNQCIPGYTHDAIAKRVEAVDRVNAVTVQGTRHWADKVVVPEVSLRPTLDNGA